MESEKHPMFFVLDIICNKISGFLSGSVSLSSVVHDSRIDKKASIRKKVRVYHSKIDKYTYVCRNTIIQNTAVGAFCSISEDCSIGMPSHPTHMVSTSPVFLGGSNYLHKNFSKIPYEDCPITRIGNDVWIGAGVKIKSGVRIGDGAIIAAGAVVTKNVPAYTIVGGIPAQVIRKRFSDDVIDALEKSSWWKWDEKDLYDKSLNWEEPEEFLSSAEERRHRVENSTY